MGNSLYPSGKPQIRRSLAESLLSCTQYENESGEAALFGSAAHSFIAAYALICLEAQEETRLADVERLALESFYRWGGIPQGRLQEFLTLCDDFARSHLADLDTLIAVERTLVHEDDFAVWNCTVDRLDRADGGDRDDEPTAIRIRDYKTEQGEMDHSFQEQFYVQMVFLTMPSVQEVCIEFDLVRRRFQREPEVYVRGQLDSWWGAMTAAVAEKYRQREAGIGKPTGGAACQYCALRATCAASIEPYRSIPENDDQADEIFGELVRMWKAADEREAALKKWFDGRPARVISGYEVGFLAPREDSWHLTATLQEVREWATLNGLDPDEWIRVSTADLGTATKRLFVEHGLAEMRLSDPTWKARKWLAPKKSREEVAS